MTHTHYPSRSDWLDDLHRFADITRAWPGLPQPNISPARVTYDYRHLTDAETARAALDSAERILSAELGVSFEADFTKAVGTYRSYLRVAVLPDHLAVVLAARAEHFDGMDATVREPTGAAA